MPCVVKQLLTQTTDVMNMFGMEYKMVSIVAVVRNIEHTTTKITYELEDITGSIPGHYWMEENDTRQINIQMNTYVRAIGSMRSQNDVRSLLIFSIHPLTGGINDVNAHLLEMINARYVAEEIARGGGFPVKEAANGVTKMDFETSSTINEELDDIKGKDRTILELIRSYAANDTGCPRSEIIGRFPNFQPREIENMLQSLIDSGHLYTTIDQDHFQSCF